MQRNTACFIGHHLLRSRGLNPDNPATQLVEWLVLSERCWGKAEEASDARLSVWSALRERGQAVEELATYWRLADELPAMEKEVAKARQTAMPLPILWPLGPIAQNLAVLDSLVQQELATFRIIHVLVLIYAIGAALNDFSASGKAAKSILRLVLNLEPTEARLIGIWRKVIDRAGRDISELAGSTRSYIRKGIELEVKDFERKFEGPPRGLTARGGNAEDRNRMAANLGREIAIPVDRDETELKIIELLDSDRLNDCLRPLLPKLVQRLNARQNQLLEAVLLQGIDPSKAWTKRSDWNGLVNKGKRVRKAHSGSR